MRKKSVLILCLLEILLLTACGGEGSSSAVFEKDGFTVDPIEQTITKGDDIYTYTISGSSSRSQIEITYPNGATYFFEWQGSSGHGGWSNDYDPVRYADGDTLMDLINFRPPRESRGNPLPGLLLILLGLFNLITPRTAWYLSYGWRYKNAEPSDAALVLGRIGGGAAVLFGLLLCFV